MNRNCINSILYDIPENVDYTSSSDELDLEDISVERIDKVKSLLYKDDEYIIYQASRLLTSWGIEEGFDTLKKLLVENKLQGMIQHRIYGYDETYTYILDAFVSYWTSRVELGKGDETRKAIFEPICTIIKTSNNQLFQISGLFWLVSDYGFVEYVPLLKEHLQIIIKNPEDNYWRIHDVIELFLNVDSDFVLQVLKENDQELSDFGF
ncbi:hypothetical protein [Psychrobacter alimentarius]|uniref:hypothetical protein n=1 Tax=Psychrobacter alimentarius TaxID=261164 RepID=UPI001919E427|nr:hypothetical protein [Psychrobacter alimentarius]